MPLRQLSPTHPPEYEPLVDRLVQEWQQPNQAVAEPLILEERSGRPPAMHVYVIWSDWKMLDRERRGEIIMDAAERVKAPGDVAKITIAMGLTPDEADRFNLKWR